MVTPGELITHPFVQAPSHQPLGDSDVRQFDGSRLCQQAVGNSLRLPLLIDRATSPMDGIQQGPTGSEVPAGTIQRPGGPTQPPQPSPGCGMVASPSVSEGPTAHVGFPHSRLVRNAKLPLYCSLMPDPQALFEDAFWHPWDNLDTYALPPFHLVERVVARVRETPNLSMTLVAPLWPEKAWFAELLPLLTQPPLALPLWDRLLRQPNFHQFHGGVHALNPHSWRLSSVSSDSRAFREELHSRYPAVSRESTARLYQSQWLSFCGWCRGRGIAPIDATIPLIVDFLIHLWRDKGFSLSALKGYCSAINSVLALKGTDLAESLCEVLSLCRPAPPGLGCGPGR